MSRATSYLLASPAGVLVAGLLLGPVVLLVRVSLYEPAGGRGFFVPGTWTGDNFAAATDHAGLRLLGFTAAFGAAVAATAVALGYALALFIRSLGPTARRVAVAAVLLPKLASALVVMFGLRQLLSAAGPVSRGLVALGVVAEPVTLSRNVFAALAGEVYLVLPYAVLVLLIQLGRIDPAWEAAARGLGASRWQAFRRVTLPLSVPGLVLAGQLGLMCGVGAFLGPMLLANPADQTLAVEVHRQAFDRQNWPRAAAGAVVLTLTAAGLGALFALAARRSGGGR
ncbi:MAG: ABC transporter permease subunit [Gemmataceae bacterium]|nr:ABC transporter permease subunit [Gemmataceae bacterium]